MTATETTGIACYVYGIVPADVETDPEVRGVGDPPAPVEVVSHGDIAALVSEIPRDKPVGLPEHFRAHESLLDAAAVETPVLPFRFGAVVPDRDAVGEMLAVHHDEFRTALDELEGRVEYLVKGRYDEQAVLGEVLAENDEAARLREEIRSKPGDAARDERIALGELINAAGAAKRDADTAAVADVLSPHSTSITVREPTHELDAANVAFLVAVDREQAFLDAVDALVAEWEGRVGLRLLGPLAPYDFVAPRTAPEG